MRSSKLAFCCAILTAFHLAGRPAQGSTSAGGEPPKQDQSGYPKVTHSAEDPNEDQEWTPLLFKKEHQPMPALREVFEGIKRGGPETSRRRFAPRIISWKPTVAMRATL
jgi:hypothetical protein